MEVSALTLVWMLAGATYLTSQLLHQTIDESRATTAKILEINQALRQSESALRESKRRYRLITENSSDLIAMFDQGSQLLTPAHPTGLCSAMIRQH